MNINIKNRFLIILFSITILFTILTLLIYQIFFYIQNDILKKLVNDILLHMTMNLESEFKRIKRFSSIIMTDAKIQNDLRRYYQTDDVYEKTVIGDEINERLYQYSFEEKYCNALYIFDTHDYEFKSRNDLPEIDDHMKFELQNEAKWYYGGNMWFPNESLIWPLLSVRTIRDYKDLSLHTLGTLAIGIDIDIDEIIESTLNSNLYFKIELAVLLGDVVYLSDNTFENSEFLEMVKNAEYGDIISINNNKYLVSTLKSSDDELSYICIFPYHVILKMLYKLTFFLFIMYLFIFSLIAFFAVKFTTGITNPIEHLAAIMKKVEEDKFDLAAYTIKEYGKSDEIGILYKEFRVMLEKIDNLINENYKKRIVAKDAQFRALQAQINPHFLYNTLESINWIAKLNNQDKIASMVKALGNMLRISINSKVIFTIKEQLDALQDYVTIQKVRYEERLDVEITGSEEVYNYGLPKLIIQPIVENSIKYGLEALTRACRIEIMVVKVNGSVKIMVTDNGPGMKKEFIDKLINGKIAARGSGLGLKNIRERLVMIYGEEFSLDIQSVLHKETIVEIIVPAWPVDYYYNIINAGIHP